MCWTRTEVRVVRSSRDTNRPTIMPTIKTYLMAMPFASLDLDLLEQNIRAIVARAGDKKVRLASKSLRSVSVIKRILAAFPTFQGVMVYCHAGLHGCIPRVKRPLGR
ncbi:MAG: hypothetical protein PVS3B3_06670 [Ktedonobacteraceae bacterium]